MKKLFKSFGIIFVLFFVLTINVEASSTNSIYCGYCVERYEEIKDELYAIDRAKKMGGQYLSKYNDTEYVKGLFKTCIYCKRDLCAVCEVIISEESVENIIIPNKPTNYIYSTYFNYCFYYLFVAVVVFFIFFIKNKIYKKTSYYQVTKTPYFLVKTDKGKKGEYTIYKNLKKFEKNGGKFLFNLYIPKNNGETTEIDVLLICKKGIFVFESKNYKGTIYGNENDDEWMQVTTKTRTYKNGRYKTYIYENNFYNPIIQNQNHIKYLKKFINEKIPVWSIIAFSNKAFIKVSPIKISNIKITKYGIIYNVLLKICNQQADYTLSDIEIDYIYKNLYPYTQVSKEEKRKHINNIKNRYK